MKDQELQHLVEETYAYVTKIANTYQNKIKQTKKQTNEAIDGCIQEQNDFITTAYKIHLYGFLQWQALLSKVTWTHTWKPVFLIHVLEDQKEHA